MKFIGLLIIISTSATVAPPASSSICSNNVEMLQHMKVEGGRVGEQAWIDGSKKKRRGVVGGEQRRAGFDRG